WQTLVENMKEPKNEVTIGIGGKYTDLKDAYVSITKAITHASAHLGVNVITRFIETTELDEEAIISQLPSYDGVIIPGGFGQRGISGKIALIEKIREQTIPFLGICLGLQCAVIEYARNECGLKNANSTEFDSKTPYPVIDLLPTQQKVYRKGGTMRLGGYLVKIKENTLAHSIYQEKNIRERFRHRYEVNPDYIPKLKAQGMIFSGTSIDNEVVHIIELPNHPFFIGTQFHPEFLSRFEEPSNLFTAFIQACVVRKSQKKIGEDNSE
ncbi:MAG: CTP synthase, partial [Candidatus Heimdallarchaeota archaeon]|nr:CTP synthase [Candidatus Heimdallarchaeota archaeon]